MKYFVALVVFFLSVSLVVLGFKFYKLKADKQATEKKLEEQKVNIQAGTKAADYFQNQSNSDKLKTCLSDADNRMSPAISQGGDNEYYQMIIKIRDQEYNKCYKLYPVD